MRILAWNIQQGGGGRRERIGTAILAHRPDLIALIEFVPNSSASLFELLHRNGFTEKLCSERQGFNYAVCVFSKSPIQRHLSGISLLEDSGLWLEVSVPAHGFKLGVLHAPTSSRLRMREYLSALVTVAEKRSRRSFLFVGDFNTGEPPADGPIKNFGDVDRFTSLQTAGFTDVWRHLHPGCIEYTWCRNGKSYRIDHALASASLLPRIERCIYSHGERECGSSDHSVLLLEVSDYPAGVAEEEGFEPPDEFPHQRFSRPPR